MNREPIGYEGSPWNLYAYVGGMPTIHTDPSGLGSWHDWWFGGSKPKPPGWKPGLIRPGNIDKWFEDKILELGGKKAACQALWELAKNPKTPDHLKRALLVVYNDKGCGCIQDWE